MQVVAVAGHAGHGKSTLVRALAGVDPKRPGDVRFGLAAAELDSGRSVTFVDLPGHERFIGSVIEASESVDAAVLVVAADEGVQAQTLEHAEILEALGLRSGIIAVTKADLARTVPVLRGTIFEHAQVLEVASLAGRGVQALRDAIDHLLRDAGHAPDRGRPRVFVSRFSGGVATGTLTGGTLSAGEDVTFAPSGQSARVRAIETFTGRARTAEPGDRIAITLGGISELKRGEALLVPGQADPSDAFAARVRASRVIDHAVAEKGAYALHIGAAEVPCRLRLLEDGNLEPGGSMLAQVFTMRPVPMWPGDRFIVRDTNRWETLVGGLVLEAFGDRTVRGDAAVIDRLLAVESSLREESLEQIVSDRRVIALDELAALAGYGSGEMQRLLREAPVVTTRSFALDRAHAVALREDAAQSVGDYHAQHPLEPGMPREHLRALLGTEPRLFSELTEQWIADGALRAEGTSVRLPTHGLVLSPEQQAHADTALHALRSGGASPPPITDLGLPADVLRALVRQGDVIVIAPDIAYAADELLRVEHEVASLIERVGKVTVAEVRDAVQTSRKYAVPLLEYFDQTRLTSRKGDHRVLGPRGREMLGL